MGSVFKAALAIYSWCQISYRYERNKCYIIDGACYSVCSAESLAYVCHLACLSVLSLIVYVLILYEAYLL